MHQDPSARCASIKAAVPPQQPWRRFIRGLILPKQSSRESKRCHRLSPRDQEEHFDQEAEEEEEGSSSSSSAGEDVCSTCNDVPFRINERLRCIGCNKRRPSFSDTESVLDIVKMPVGTTNPVLKSSFSLTSLRSSTPTDSPEHCVPLRLKTERAYHSLTKKSRQSREQDKEQWRKSWGSGISQDGKEFWEGFQADYDYLMAQNILDRDVSEMSVENGIPRTPPVWSHSEFMDHFAQLYSWLKGIQDSVYGKEENVTDWKLRAERLEDMQRQRFRLEDFKEESKTLIARHPDCEGEVLWRMKHISDKWETVEAMMGGCQKCEGEKGSEEKVKHEIRCLRKWLRELDIKLKPLSFKRGWTKAELEEKSKELMVLHRDIESQRKIFSSLFKLCDKEESQRWLGVAGALERKYHLHYLSALEWQCHIESLINQQNKVSSNASNESDGEPVPKIARFAQTQDPEDNHESEDSDSCDGLKSDEKFSKDDDWRMDTSVERTEAESPTGQFPLDTMVGAKVDTPKESILGLGGSASTLGTNSRNANTSFSCANDGTDSRPTAAGHPTSGQRENRLRDVNTAIEPEANRSKKRLPNTGSFSWKHLDTDSEQEKLMSKEDPKGKKSSKECLDGKEVRPTSSEAGVDRKPKAAVRLEFKEEDARQVKYFSAKNIPSMPGGKEPISSRKLVERAEELVRCMPCKSWKSRRGRTRTKGSKEKVLDSCDASGEYTEDSDDSQKSEGNENGIVSCRWYGSADGILEGKFVPRRERHLTRHRPLSMSAASWSRTPKNKSLKTQASVSESALNQMMELDGHWTTPGRNYKTLGGEDGSGGSLRRRRTKIRKQTSKKSDTGSDVLTLSGSDSANASPPGKQISTIVKSGSFSGVIRRQKSASGFDSVTGTETEEERTRLMAPVFRLGPSEGAVTVAAERDKVQVEEQLSLNWDSYQEKYQSEAYSEEPPDSDSAKKLLEFGEDYGKFLGNQSDCASTRSFSFTGWSRGKIDSDSEVDEVRQTLQESLEQLNLWEIKFSKTIGSLLPASDDGPNDCASKTFLDEIMAACKRNVECLTKLLVEVKSEMPLKKEYNYILNVKESWENFKSTAELHKAKQLRREMVLLKEELLGIAAAVDALDTSVASREELEAKITKVQNELNLIKKGKSRLLQANVSVHRFLAMTKHADTALRDEVTELYQLWDQTFCRVSSQLLNLQSLSQTWHDVEDHLAQLQCALKTDALKVLDFALKREKSSSGACVFLQDIAGILSGKDSGSKESLSMAEVTAQPSLVGLSTEGSLSDSGISDSGSEQELSEREKRLSQLKRLAKRLESILAPGSQALSSMFKRIEEAESELRKLQKSCRDLIVRSASTEEIRMILASTPALGKLDLDGSCPVAEKSCVEGLRTRSPVPAELDDTSKDSPPAEAELGECEAGKPGKKFWLWRLLRYALPFQLALVALLCIASILEPRCCDSLNNLEFSLHPQLRYDSGPPPV